MVKPIAAKLAKYVEKAKNSNPKSQYKNLTPVRIHNSTNEDHFEKDKVEHVVVQMLFIIVASYVH
jgi:hypothetical protein